MIRLFLYLIARFHTNRGHYLKALSIHKKIIKKYGVPDQGYAYLAMSNLLLLIKDKEVTNTLFKEINDILQHENSDLMNNMRFLFATAIISYIYITQS